jgi:hypothetical protein
MEKEFKVYKNGLGEHKLISSKDISGRHREMTFDTDFAFEPEDGILSLKDKMDGNSDNILVVEKVSPERSIVVRTVNRDFITNLRKFDEGELFTVVATYRNVE